jgi:hypothetical protein
MFLCSGDPRREPDPDRSRGASQMHSFRKFNGAWCVYSETARPGETVTITKRNGGTSTVVLGQRVAMMTYAIAPRPVAPEAPRATEVVGDLSRIVAMLQRAAGRLRYPAIVLDGFRVSIAGQRAAQPGSLTVTGVNRVFNSFRQREERPWYGRVSTAGVFEATRNAPAGLGERLRCFAADPAGVAAAHGRLHGSCCFCNRPLRDERSTAVGYGPDCAENYGLEWGVRAAAAAQAPAAIAPAPADLVTRDADSMAPAVA